MPEPVAYSWSCTGKVAFESAPIAKQVASRRSRRGVPGTPYRCKFCRQWHIGSGKTMPRAEKVCE